MLNLRPLQTARSVSAALALGVPLLATAQTWPFTYPTGQSGTPLLDLRYLNEKQAGETGYVKVAADGRGFVKGDGKPIRFWPVCAYGYRLKPEEMTANAKFLAKMGVNMVRIHGSVSPKGKGKAITDADMDEIDHIQRNVGELEKQGIYATISPFWANGGHSGAAASWGLGYGDGEDIWGLLIFDDKLRDAYKGWLRKLYLSPNPYTGTPLAKDPAVAIAQVQNEDSLLFWTFQAIKPAQKAALAKKFAAWLVKKYGSVQEVHGRWSGADQKGDDWNAGSPALLDTWVLTQPQKGGMKTRTDDQTAFLIDQQRGFYADIVHFLKNDLGYKGLVNASNWFTADPVHLNDAERYTYTPGDVSAVNRYYNGGVHKGPNDGWRIDEGDFFQDVSGLKDPRAMPFDVKQTVGQPFVITETGWVHPLGYQAEAPLLAAAYDSLTGLQGLYWFELGAKEYDLDPMIGFVTTPDGSHPMSKWTDSVPQLLGQFPAAALIYRNGYVKQGLPVIHEERTRASIDARETPLIAEDPSFDPNHHAEDSRAGAQVSTFVDPLAYLTGPVEVKFDGDPANDKIKNLTPYIDHEKQTVRSVTGELNLDYGKGVFTLDTPKAQAVAGFMADAGGAAKTKDVSFQCSDPYAAITVVPMDEKPIATSGKLLIQMGTVVRPTGWKQEPATLDQGAGKPALRGFKVVNSGKAPLQSARLSATLVIANPHLRKITVLDPAGFATATIPGTTSGGKFTVRLPADALYAIAE
jgi:hypothetical protein